MKAPAFSCRCIAQCEAVIPEDPAYASGELTDNHIGQFFDAVWRAHHSRYAMRVIRGHYNAHALGAPHSHIKFLRGNDQFPSGFSWDAVECSCHHVEQNAEPAADLMRRGQGLTNAAYIATAP